ncbi:MAG: head GIN domain-containing protein [Chitinophagaceae bacterium]
MKKIFLPFLMLIAFVTTGSAQKTINDPNVEVREAKNFDAIELSNAFDVYLTQSNEESVAVSASDPRYRDNIKVEVKGGVLIIRYDNKGKWNTGNKKLKAYISFKQLNKLNVSGACDVYIVDDWKADNLKLDLSGASNLKGKMIAQKLMIDLSGASDLTLTGTVGQLNIEASGASDFKGYDLAVEYCNAKASGASDIKITVNKELSAEASGASDVKYKGSGLIRDIKTSGASSISRRS